MIIRPYLNNKTMKKIITLVAAIAFATTAFSQWSANFGGNLSQFTGKNSYGSTKFGYQIGFTTYSTKLFSIQPGLFLINKGATNDKYRTSLNYLQVPINLMLGYNVNEDWRVVVGAGLYGSLGLWGNIKDDGKKKENGVDFFGRSDDSSTAWKALDFGWQAVIGIQHERYGLRLAYQPGLARINGSYNADKNDYSKKGPNAFNNSFMFTLSYTFGELY